MSKGATFYALALVNGVKPNHDLSGALGRFCRRRCGGVYIDEMAIPTGRVESKDVVVP